MWRKEERLNVFLSRLSLLLSLEAELGVRSEPAPVGTPKQKDECGKAEHPNKERKPRSRQ